MSDPLSYLPFALAARGGTVDNTPVSQLVAAGFRLLQEAAPLVRALSGRRAAICLGPSAQFVTALAAAEGRGALLLDPATPPATLALELAAANAGAVFTVQEMASRWPATLPVVFLDESPRQARVVLPEREFQVDLGSHVALDLAGDAEAAGAEEEAVLLQVGRAGDPPAVFTHHLLLIRARRVVAELGLQASDLVLATRSPAEPFALVMSCLAPLMAGAHVMTMPTTATDVDAVLSRLERGAITVVVGRPSLFASLVARIEAGAAPLRAPSLRLGVCGGEPAPAGLAARWEALCGIPLREGRA